MSEQSAGFCPVCGEEMMPDQEQPGGSCVVCATLASVISERPELVQRLWAEQYGGSPLHASDAVRINSEAELPEVLDAEQKAHKIRNLLQAMRRADLIERRGSKNAPEWRLKGPE